MSVLIVVSNSDFVDETSLDVSLDKSDISVLSEENVSDDKSDISEEVDRLNSLISLDNSLEV